MRKNSDYIYALIYLFIYYKCNNYNNCNNDTLASTTVLYFKLRFNNNLVRIYKFKSKSIF